MQGASCSAYDAFQDSMHRARWARSVAKNTDPLSPRMITFNNVLFRLAMPEPTNGALAGGQRRVHCETSLRLNHRDPCKTLCDMDCRTCTKGAVYSRLPRKHVACQCMQVFVVGNQSRTSCSHSRQGALLS